MDYKEYILEREGFQVLENIEGFAIYKIEPKSHVYIKDIYINPGMRDKGIASLLADAICAIAKDVNCRKLIGSICPEAAGSNTSLKVLLGYGMKLSHVSNGLIYFHKEIF